MTRRAFAPGDFLNRLAVGGVNVTLDGEELRLRAPSGVITDKVADRVRRAKPLLIAYLRESRAAPPLDLAPGHAEADTDCDSDLIALGREVEAGISGELTARHWTVDEEGTVWSVSAEELLDACAEQEAYDAGICALYAAALAGRLPVEPVKMAKGLVMENANAWVLKAVERCRQIRAAFPEEKYMDRCSPEHRGLEFLADWRRQRNLELHYAGEAS